MNSPNFIHIFLETSSSDEHPVSQKNVSELSVNFENATFKPPSNNDSSQLTGEENVPEVKICSWDNYGKKFLRYL